MFCPNCGKDCGSAKFCPECGQKLQGKPEKEQKSSVWSVGMPCPHCGGTKLDGGCCAFCGAQLEKDVSSFEDQRLDIPYGVYKCFYGYLELKKDVLIIKNKHTPEVSFPYTSIAKIKYTPMTRFKFGYLSIRTKADSDKPFPDSDLEAMKDETTVLHYSRDENLFRFIYRVLLVNFCEE